MEFTIVNQTTQIHEEINHNWHFFPFTCNGNERTTNIQSNLTLRELFVRVNLSLKVKFFLKSSLLKQKFSI